MLNQIILIQAISKQLKVLYRLLNPLGRELSTFLYFFSQKRTMVQEDFESTCENIVKETETQKKIDL